MPPKLSDVDLSFSIEINAPMVLDYNKHEINLRPYLKNQIETCESLIRKGLTHLKWHPNHGIGYRTSIFNTSGASSIGELNNYSGRNNREPESVEGAIQSIYNEAVEEFKDFFDTEFDDPTLILENTSESISRSSYSPKDLNTELAGYNIDVENSLIVLNSEILEELHHEILKQDFQYMLKRYYDLSLKSSFERRTFPYASRLSKSSDIEVEEIYFDELEEDVLGKYVIDPKHIIIDISKLPKFNPETGIFDPEKGLDGEAIKLHETVHHIDYNNHDGSYNYKSEIGETDTNDPRNAVFELPTTFEVAMTGKKTRKRAYQAFMKPNKSLEFFEGYPISDLEEGKRTKISDPYNMALFTGLTIHKAMIQELGIKEGTRKAREIFLGNSWNLEEMETALEFFGEFRDVRNIPLEKRQQKADNS